MTIRIVKIKGREYAQEVKYQWDPVKKVGKTIVLSSPVFTSNKSFSEWGEVMGDQVVASAILDRILHHCTVVNIKGESYRLKDRRKGNPPPYREK